MKTVSSLKFQFYKICIEDYISQYQVWNFGTGDLRLVYVLLCRDRPLYLPRVSDKNSTSAVPWVKVLNLWTLNFQWTLIVKWTFELLNFYELQLFNFVELSELWCYFEARPWSLNPNPNLKSLRIINHKTAVANFCQIRNKIKKGVFFWFLTCQT